MFRKLFFVALVVLAAVSGVACGKDGPLPGPTPIPSPTPDPIPTPSDPRMVTIGEKIYFFDADGKRTHMWLRLLSEPNPSRGSGTGTNWFNIHIELGMDARNNPWSRAGFHFWSSPNGESHGMSIYRLGGILNGEENTTRTNPVENRILDGPPQYLIIEASTPGDSLDIAEEGVLVLYWGYAHKGM